MLATVDIGNTKTELGLWDGGALVRRQRAPTGAGVAAFAEALGAATGVALAGVVPGAVRAWAREAERSGLPFAAFDGTNIPGLRVAVDNPASVGPDRVVNALAALEWRGAPVIAVDLGTATTFDVVGRGGVFLGGAIVIGANTAIQAVAGATARLPPVPLAAPPSVIGAGTVPALQSGAWFGYVALVEGLLARIRSELGERAPCVATGGLANLLAPACPSFDKVDDALTLRGLRRAWELTR